ncbi:MAG: hypothetical protein EA427_11900 [Spirochaetaceae bacterium]|nr:MAG: hypothetical protein EA427_11900 [Spirochaetaceae bacterium]
MQLPVEARRSARLLLTVPVLWVTLLSCTFDYSAAGVEAGRTEEIPQVELFNVRMVVERDNRLELSAGRVATYRDRREQEFVDLTFREYGPGGDIRVEGWAEAGAMDLDTEDVELLGTVWFYSLTEETRLESSYLFWDQAERILVGKPDGSVLVVRDDGSWVEGSGLRLDGRRNRLELTGGLQGEFTGGGDAE